VDALTSSDLLGGVEHLDLACNVLGPEGTAALAPLLQTRTHDDNDDGDAGSEGDDGGGNDGGDGGSGVRGGRRWRQRGLYSLDLAGTIRVLYLFFTCLHWCRNHLVPKP
jgi:hypothetical protein